MRALEGIQVVSTALNIPGPVAAAMLRDMGASVAKVEPPWGDPLSLASQEWYGSLTAGLRVLHLDLKTSDGRRALEPLLEGADLLITAARPASLQRLGLGWPELHSTHPRLCHVAIIGHAPPRAEVPGHDLTYQAEAGLLAGAVMPRTLIADIGGAQQVAIAALELLLARDRTAEAGTAVVSLATAATLFAEPLRHGLTSIDRPLGGMLPFYSIYSAREGTVALAALEPQFRAALERELHVSASDREGLAKVFSGKSAQEWEHWAEERGIPLAAVRAPQA